MSLVFSGTNGVTFPDSSLQAAAASPYVLKNRIINGDMRIDQRNAGASVTPVNAGYINDRWTTYLSQASKITAQRDTVVPSGYSNSLKLTVSSAVTPSASDFFALATKIEGFNVADFDFGKSSAQTITLSFWVRSSITGTYALRLCNSAFNRSYIATYTISSANTFEYKTITIAGDTSGTWLTDNGIGLNIQWDLGSGSNFNGTAGSWTGSDVFRTSSSTNWISTNGATFYITGVQLEVGSSATPFERRLYNQELANCQRYYWQQNYTQSNNRFGMGTAAGAVTDGFQISLPVPMRTTPSVVFSNVGLYDGTSTFTISSIGANYSTPTLLSALINNSSSITAGKSVQLYAINSSASVSTSGAEL
jgi:hypothetical protein